MRLRPQLPQDERESARSEDRLAGAAEHLFENLLGLTIKDALPIYSNNILKPSLYIDFLI